MQKWLLVALLLLQLHFAASYLVPLDAPSRAEFGGLLGWFWPWAYGDAGPLGQITPAAGFPIAGFYIAMTAAGTFALAALSVLGIWVPTSWWRGLALAGAVVLVALMSLFFGPTKFAPLLAAAATLYVTTARPDFFAVGS